MTRPDSDVAGHASNNGHATNGGLIADPSSVDARLREITTNLLEAVGEDPHREGLLETPRRLAESMQFLTSGYSMDPHEVVGGALFNDDYDELVLVRDIEVYSMCEHHLLPFFGKAHIGYQPRGKVVGLSKLPRLVDVFARRLQLQERLTRQIADSIQTLLEPRGVGVVIEASHLCMMMRGVEKQNSSTVTSALLGSFRSDQRTRGEFLSLVRGS